MKRIHTATGNHLHTRPDRPECDTGPVVGAAPNPPGMPTSGCLMRSM
jgi:hypothetical protein